VTPENARDKNAGVNDGQIHHKLGRNA
jgi:hypothetical protein